MKIREIIETDELDGLTKHALDDTMTPGNLTSIISAIKGKHDIDSFAKQAAAQNVLSIWNKGSRRKSDFAPFAEKAGLDKVTFDSISKLTPDTKIG